MSTIDNYNSKRRSLFYRIRARCRVLCEQRADVVPLRVVLPELLHVAKMPHDLRLHLGIWDVILRQLWQVIQYIYVITFTNNANLYLSCIIYKF